jgi:hypothetical protein
VRQTETLLLYTHGEERVYLKEDETVKEAHAPSRPSSFWLYDIQYCT